MYRMTQILQWEIYLERTRFTSLTQYSHTYQREGVWYVWTAISYPALVWIQQLNFNAKFIQRFFPPLFNIFISSRAHRDPPHPMKMYSVICLGVFVKSMHKIFKKIYSVMQGLPPNCNIGISISIFKIPNTICEKMQMLYYYSTWKRSISHGLYYSNEMFVLGNICNREKWTRLGEEKKNTWALQFCEREANAAHHYHDDTLQKPLTLKNKEEKKHTQVQIMPFGGGVNSAVWRSRAQARALLMTQ